MNTEEIKKVIEEKTGVPVVLLTGETISEIIKNARNVLEYKYNSDGTHSQDETEKILNEIEKEYGLQDNGSEQGKQGKATKQAENNNTSKQDKTTEELKKLVRQLFNSGN